MIKGIFNRKTKKAMNNTDILQIPIIENAEQEYMLLVRRLLNNLGILKQFF